MQGTTVREGTRGPAHGLLPEWPPSTVASTARGGLNGPSKGPLSAAWQWPALPGHGMPQRLPQRPVEVHTPRLGARRGPLTVACLTWP